MPDETTDEPVIDVPVVSEESPVASEEPVAEPPVVLPTDPRSLSDTEAATYTARLDTAAFSFTATSDASGFDVTNGVVTYNYRYDGSASTAVELMDRICAERGV